MSNSNNANSRTIEREIRNVLLELLRSDENNGTRIMAAKILIGQIDKGKNKNAAKSGDDIRQNGKEEISSAIAEARAILEELAASKSCRVAAPRKVAEKRKAKSNNSSR